MSHLSSCMVLYSCMQVVTGKGRQVHLRTLRRLPSRILVRCEYRSLPHSLPHKHPALIGRHTGGEGAFFFPFSGSHKGESLRAEVHSVGSSMEGMPG